MKKLLFIILLAVVCKTQVYCQDIEATTSDGKKVVLKSDFTWKYADAVNKEVAVSNKTFAKSSSASTQYATKGEKVSVWYDANSWLKNESTDPVKAVFNHKSGEIYSMIIYERMEMTMDALLSAALTNAKSVSPDARFTFQEYRIVNKTKVMCAKLEGEIQGIKFVYYSYYYTGAQGTIQVITYTSQNLFEEYKTEMTNFLNGLVITE